MVRQVLAQPQAPHFHHEMEIVMSTDKYLARIFAVVAAALVIGFLAGFAYCAVISMPPVWLESIG